MGKYLPTEIDEYFLLDAVLVFLMINYNLPLASIYFAMVLLGSLMYYVAVDQSLFRWIPFSKKHNRWTSIGVGVGIGVGFLFIYQWLQTATPLSSVFASAAFGESETIGRGVFGFLIPIAETRFFFRTILQWWAWKGNISVSSALSGDGIKLAIIFGAIFTIFHATSKGITENLALIATFLFGVISVFSILHFQELTQAIVAHIVVNSKSVGILDLFGQGALIANSWIIIIGIIGVYFLLGKNRVKRLFAA